MNGLTRLREVVARLRAPDGCPWDREQTHESLRGALVEECYEVIDAIERADDENLKEELGDLLLHVVMHAQMAGERGAFEFEEIAAHVCEKMVRRHPHVFGEKLAGDSSEVLRQWEQIKREEKGASASVLDGLPSSLPALLRAQNAQKKASRVGFDWNAAAPVLEKIEEEIAELKEAIALQSVREVESEMGDLLFSVVNLARKLDVDSETALAGSTGRFIKRFQQIEARLAGQNRKVEDATVEELNILWEEAKQTA